MGILSKALLAAVSSGSIYYALYFQANECHNANTFDLYCKFRWVTRGRHSVRGRHRGEDVEKSADACLPYTPSIGMCTFGMLS